MNPHQRMMVKTTLIHIDFLTEQIENSIERLPQKVSVYQENIERLDSIPDIAARKDELIVTKIRTGVEK
ncbi:hypothetical protein SC499_18035 [Peribacillus simplex]|uniref:hypothetical protein n=1 Tax=Peribacillus simplex TaxID=1478 RepID=UPI00298DDD29|nr:hypothetical protein [Peribacillus simplex]MDW7616582.1 hypothetical protein [Peribacillus simplex]